ncbi:Coproporphyrinogen-III oxidase [Tetrabaena socialis]|uniref:Coproporphyrinogen-III oxidase n=1 Tax=Tetrabaena socialis TaxID=47790 RepID=A0A2J8AFW1_9CHLO|nr:Coproporphyrinogen-III oxidase [Tetrabaena socialis]|eukprot:PNH11399.1 Coproporphyrinogen-III oxidase [Tetrabaena socialis]
MLQRHQWSRPGARVVRGGPVGQHRPLRRGPLLPCAAASAPARAATTFDTFVEYILDLQSRIIATGESLELGKKQFVVDRWERQPGNPNAGYGVTCVLEGGEVLEKAAVNISVLRGTLTAARAGAMSSRGRGSIDPAGGQAYAAAALSLVFHSAHPLIPTLRADVRLFQVADEAWYGGGCDLTPSYVDEADATDFHRFWKAVCDNYKPSLYGELKEWCDRYFYIPARKEHRGVGGLFFDDLSSAEAGYDVEAFVRQVGDGILDSWTPLVQRRRGTPFTEEQRQWQLLRRGRYLEFNLLYDRGVKFGLDGGRFESIMVSAPPLIAWKYNVTPLPGSPEDETLAVLRTPREWV